MKVDTDVVMKQTWLHMMADFRSVFGYSYAAGGVKALLEGVSAFRQYSFPSRSRVENSYLFKADYQLETFFKRYIFKDEVHRLGELIESSAEKFVEVQKADLSKFCGHQSTYMVVQRARKVAARILGAYDPDEHKALCRFAKRATVGVPRRCSYLHTKGRMLTGSVEHHKWFQKELLPDDELLSRITRKSKYGVVDCLKATFVPKSWKALRMICPDTTLGSLYTSGLGAVLVRRLLSAGLDISSLQAKHGELARLGSVRRHNVTLDLSSASDTITTSLLRKVLPYKWYRAVVLGRIPYLDLNGSKIRMQTVVTMGLGHTFPLQTLIFYCLIKAVCELGSIRGTVSVYGDDCIFPRRAYPFVRRIFEDLLLKINIDKTYDKDYFRESCGHDFHRGNDVRPCNIKAQHCLLSGEKLLVFLYKLWNSLSLRWDLETELPSVHSYLNTLITLHSKVGVLYVPPEMPDTAGCKVSHMRHDPWCENNIRYKRDCQFVLEGSPMSFQFKGMRDCARRFIPISKDDVSFYYWDKLRSMSLSLTDSELPYTSKGDALVWLPRRVKRKDTQRGVTRTYTKTVWYPAVSDKTVKEAWQTTWSDVMSGWYSPLDGAVSRGDRA